MKKFLKKEISWPFVITIVSGLYLGLIVYYLLFVATQLHLASIFFGLWMTIGFIYQEHKKPGSHWECMIISIISSVIIGLALSVTIKTDIFQTTIGVVGIYILALTIPMWVHYTPKFLKKLFKLIRSKKGFLPNMKVVKK